MSCTRTVEIDRRRAETLLYEVAADLRRLPVDEQTRHLHIRALAAKRAISRWCDSEPPDAPARQRALDAIVVLHEEVRRRTARVLIDQRGASA